MPLAKSYKDPLTAKPAQSVGPFQMPLEENNAESSGFDNLNFLPDETMDVPTPVAAPIPTPTPTPTPVVAQQTPPSFRMSDVPMVTDANGKKTIDYENFYKNLYEKNSKQADDNQITREDIDRNQDSMAMRALLTGFSNAAAKAGGETSTVGDTAKSLNEANAVALNARKGLASEGYTQGLSSLKEMQAAPLEDIKAQELKDAADPNSLVSKYAREYYNKLLPTGQGLAPDMSLNAISKFAPEIAKRAQEDASNKLKLEMDAKDKEFSSGENQKNRIFQASQQRNAAEERRETNREMLENRKLMREEERARFGRGKQIQEQFFTDDDKAAVRDYGNIQRGLNSNVKLLDDRLRAFNEAKSERDKFAIAQTMLKSINSLQGSDAVGAEEARRLAWELEPFMLRDPGTLFPRIGKNLDGFDRKVQALIKAGYRAADTQRVFANDVFKKYDPEYEHNPPKVVGSTVKFDPSKDGDNVGTGIGGGGSTGGYKVYVPPSQTAGR